MVILPAQLHPTDVHLWRIPLNLDPEQVGALHRTLDIDEQQHVSRLRFPKHRRRFIVRRAGARSILARYLACTPRQVIYDHADHGKPLIANSNPTDIRFSLTHSCELALLAVAAGFEVGIDLETNDPDRADRLVVKHFFAPAEIDALDGLSPHQYAQGFFNCWTRKEAFIKAIGRGLEVPLDRFEVSVDPHGPALLKWIGEDLNEHRAWSLYNLRPPIGYTAALVAQGATHHITSHDCPMTEPLSA